MPSEASNYFNDNPNDNVCRICLCGRKLFLPCLCKGTIAFIHVECLNQWKRASGREECQVCGAKFGAKIYNAQEIISQARRSLGYASKIFLLLAAITTLTILTPWAFFDDNFSINGFMICLKYAVPANFIFAFIPAMFAMIYDINQQI